MIRVLLLLLLLWIWWRLMSLEVETFHHAAKRPESNLPENFVSIVNDSAFPAFKMTNRIVRSLPGSVGLCWSVSLTMMGRRRRRRSMGLAGPMGRRSIARITGGDTTVHGFIVTDHTRATRWSWIKSTETATAACG